MRQIRLWGPYSAFGLTLAALAMAADQAHKYWMIEIYAIGEKGRVAVTPFFDLVMVWNRGVSFGQFAQESDAGRYILIGASALITAALIVWIANAQTRFIAASIALIVGGAAGNLIDRVVYGAVADFFSFHYAGYYWYVFNVADVAITLGVMGLLLDWVAPSHRNVSKSI